MCAGRTDYSDCARLLKPALQSDSPRQLYRLMGSGRPVFLKQLPPATVHCPQPRNAGGSAHVRITQHEIGHSRDADKERKPVSIYISLSQLAGEPQQVRV